MRSADLQVRSWLGARHSVALMGYVIDKDAPQSGALPAKTMKRTWRSALHYRSSSHHTGTWSDGSGRPRSALSMPTAVSRSAASGDSSR